MIALIAFTLLGGCIIIASAVVPPPSPSTSWGRMMNNESYRRNEDIPIMGDHNILRDRKDKSRNRRHRFKRSKTRDEDRIDEALFFLDQDSDDDNQFERRHHQTYHDRRRRSRKGKNNNQRLDSFRSWAFDKTGVHIPRVNIYFDPITILKLRKSWYNLIPCAIIRVGADFQTYRLGGGLWRIRGCIEDKFLGGRFTIKERKTQQHHNGNDEDDDDRDGKKSILVEYSKSWLFAGAGTIGTRLNLSAAYDITNQRGSARFGFKADNTDAVGSYHLLPGRKGLSIVPIIPLDNDQCFLIESKANVNLPEPEFVIGTDFDGTRSDGASLGVGITGDIDVEVEELNLICSF